MTFVIATILIVAFAALIYPRVKGYLRARSISPVIVLDIETTGLHAGVHEIIEICALKFDPRKSQHEAVCALIKPRDKVSAKITKITGITQEMLDTEGHDLAQVLPQVIQLIGALPVVAHNAAFDIGFLEAALGRPLTNPVYCTLEMARTKMPGLRSYKLADLAKQLGIPQPNHRADGDCITTAHLYYALVASRI